MPLVRAFHLSNFTKLQKVTNTVSSPVIHSSQNPGKALERCSTGGGTNCSYLAPERRSPYPCCEVHNQPPISSVPGTQHPLLASAGLCTNVPIPSNRKRYARNLQIKLSFKKQRRKPSIYLNRHRTSWPQRPTGNSTLVTTVRGSRQVKWSLDVSLCFYSA